MVNATPEGKLLNIIKNAQGKMRLKNELKIFTKVNIVLISLIALVLVVFLADLFSSRHKESELAMDLPEKKSEILSVSGPAAQEEDIIVKKAPLVNKDAAKNLNLLGIIDGDEKQVVIEDKEKNRNLFLYKGDSFGEFKVEEIKEGSVTLDYKGQKIELKM